jgi:tRNA A-37 threonylcarbamoyl transferase component Bud32
VQLPEPARLGEYSLLEKLGQGGMALVYRAERVGEAGFKKKVAIKRMLPAYRRDPSLLERFAAEARTNARLDHPNLVHVLDFGIEPEPYLVLEFVEGVTLAALLTRLVEKRQQLEIAAACFIGAEAAQGLDHAHRKRDDEGSPLGIVHRDVSPQNCLLSNEGAVKVSDFGLVKAADNVVQTGSGVPIGKMSYMAPEQAGNAPIDARADVFSLGIVVWEMLTMRPLMPPNDPGRASQMLVACEFKPPSRYNPSVPPALDDIVMRCLAKAPGERTPSAQALSMQLREVLHEIAPGYGRDQLARLLGWAFPEKGWVIDEPHETAAQPSMEERMSMPQIAAAEVMQRAAAMSTGQHAPVVFTTGPQPALPGAAPLRASGPPPSRSSPLPWIAVLVIGGVVALALLVVIAAVAIYALRGGDGDAAPTSTAIPAVPPPPAPMMPGPSVLLEARAPGAHVFHGDRDLGVSPVRVTTDQLDGQPIVAIAPGHEPALLPADELVRAVRDGRGPRELAMVPSDRPSRVVYVRYPRPATAQRPFSSDVLGPVPGVLIVPWRPNDVDGIVIVEPGRMPVRLETRGCDPSSLCVLELGTF